MSQSSEATHQLSADERRRLLAEMLQKKASRSDERPLSFGQERLWLMARLDPGSSLYNIAVAYRIEGPLDLTILKESIERVAERHEVLRATFPAGKGQPVQKVALEVPSVFAVREHGDLTEDWRTASVPQFAVEEAKRPFDLTRGPLWRVSVFRKSGEEHYIVLVMHHIVSDAWSFYIFCQELAEFYDAGEHKLDADSSQRAQRADEEGMPHRLGTPTAPRFGNPVTEHQQGRRDCGQDDEKAAHRCPSYGCPR